MSRVIVLANLGSPASPSESDVRNYLREFLMDPYVIDSPWFMRWCVVNFAILPTRPRESAHAYQKIWTSDGSPLVVTTHRVRELLHREIPDPIFVTMRYGAPSMPHVAAQIAREYPNVREVLLVPLYPHFAMSSVQTCVEYFRRSASKHLPHADLLVLPPFYAHEHYIDALFQVAAPYLQQPFDHLLMSYHGIPERHIHMADRTRAHCLQRADCCERAHPAHATCYRAQCFATTSAFTARAGLRAEQYSVSFQSRLGKDPWLRPFTDEILAELPQRGIKRLLVMSPAFVADCLETLEELAMRGRETFLAAGGESFELIPCLNTHPAWIACLLAMIE